jgi:hypothetical protein
MTVTTSKPPNFVPREQFDMVFISFRTKVYQPNATSGLRFPLRHLARFRDLRNVWKLRRADVGLCLSPDGTLLDAEIIRQGYGFALTRYTFSRMEEFRRLEREARRIGGDSGLKVITGEPVPIAGTKRRTFHVCAPKPLCLKGVHWTI